VNRSEGLKRSRRQEKDTATKFGGRQTPGSGNRWYAKGDVRTPELLIENKYTGKTQVTLKALDLRKICDEATAEGLLPVLGVELSGEHFVVMPRADFLEILGR
jgi:hypothetical protein